MSELNSESVPDRAWMVRAGNDNELIETFLDKETVCIAWSEIGDLSSTSNRDDVKDRYREAYPEQSKYRVRINGGQIYKFALAMETGDLVISYDKSSRTYIAGEITGPYQYQKGVIEDYPHHRSVQWYKNNGDAARIDRDNLTQKTRNSLGSTLTVFNLDSYTEELFQLAQGEEFDEIEEDDDSPPFFDEVQSQSDELISDMISRMDPYDFQDLVAEIIRTMGFQAESAPPGPDQGVDIVAHPDEFGFEDPIIKVQVKHRQSSSGIGDIQRFIGALNPKEKGIFVSTGGFTSEAEKTVDKTEKRVKLYDREEFVDWLKEHYEDIDPEFKALVPLRNIWIPTEKPGG